ncbi:MAG: hypothetical protein IPL45_00335 [Actinomycetales bacterium]|nr:hypothetical protein [Actinomycetales bacterium]
MSRAASGSAPQTERDATMWIPLPTADQVGDPSDWATDTAERTARAQGFLADADAIERFGFVLARLLEMAPPSTAGGRFLFSPDVRDGFVVFDMLVCPAAGDSLADQRALLGVDTLGEFSGQLDDLREQGLEGMQLLRVDEIPAIEAPPGESSSEQMVVATLVCVLRREVPGLGECDVVAATRSGEIQMVFASLLPVWDLLTGPELMPDPGGR